MGATLPRANAKSEVKIQKRWCCAVCYCRYWVVERKRWKLLPACPYCKEKNDVFPADDDGWDEQSLKLMWDWGKDEAYKRTWINPKPSDGEDYDC